MQFLPEEILFNGITDTRECYVFHCLILSCSTLFPVYQSTKNNCTRRVCASSIFCNHQIASGEISSAQIKYSWRLSSHSTKWKVKPITTLTLMYIPEMASRSTAVFKPELHFY